MFERDPRRRLRERVGIDASLAKDAPIAGVGVLQVGRGVALQRDHLRFVVNVIADPILTKVRVLDGPQTHDRRYVVALVRWNALAFRFLFLQLIDESARS